MKEATSKKQLERILETIAEGILIIDINGFITYANESAEEILGVKRSDLVGRPYIEPGYKVTTLEGKPYPIEERPITQALRTGNLIRNVEYVAIRPDGRQVIISVNATPIRDQAENVTGVVISVADITSRKQAEENLRESERRFREMLEGVELIALILDAEGNIVFANDFLLALTSRQREDVVGKSWFKYFIPEDSREETEQVFHELITTGTPTHYENDILTKEEDRLTIEFSNVLLRDPQGNAIGTANIGHDITADRQAAKEIRESRKQVLDILESITDGFFALDNDWRFSYLNQRAAQLIGKRKEELLFRNMWEAVPETVGTIFEKEYRRAKEEMVPTTFDAFYPPLNKWFEVHAYPFENGLSVYVSDITERKRIAEALKESESRYRTLFEDAPIALWEQDASEITNHIARLKSQGVKDFRAYFEEHPEITAEMLSTIKIIDVNKATLGLYGAGSKEYFIRNFGATTTKEGLDAVREFLISYAERAEQKFEAEFTSRTFKGDTIYVAIITFIPPGYEETRSKVFVATIDITERKRAKELSDALNDINAAVTSTLHFNEILQRVVVDSAKAMGSERALILLREGDYWVAKYSYAWPKEFIGTRLTEDQARATTRAARARTLIVVNDAFQDERVNREVMQHYNIRSFLGIPLITRGEVIGSLFFSYHSGPISFSEAQIDFAGKLATAVSVAMGNARLFEEFKKSTDDLSKRSKSLQALLDVALDIASGLGLDELMYKIAKNASELTGAEVGGVGLINEVTGAVVYPFVYNLPEVFKKVYVPQGRGLTGRVITQQKPMILDEYQDFPDKVSPFAGAGLHSVIMVPLMARGKIIGTLFVANKDPEKKLGDEDALTLEGIGRHAAIALDNARLYGRP